MDLTPYGRVYDADFLRGAMVEVGVQILVPVRVCAGFP